MREYLSFERFLTPRLIQVAFWVGVGVTTVRGITMLASRFGGAAVIINGLIWLFVGPIVVRVLCEVIMAIFSMAGRDSE